MEQIRLGQVVFTNYFQYIKQTKIRVVFNFQELFNMNWIAGSFNYCGRSDDSDEFLIRRALSAEWEIR